MLSDILYAPVSYLQTQKFISLGLLILSLLLMWRGFVAACQYASRPRNMLISGRTLLFGQWLSAMDFIFRGADRIAQAYAAAGSAPFAIPALSNYQVLVSSKEDVMKLANAPEEVMSFRKALSDRLFFTYTMGGFTPNHIDPHNSIPVRVFKVLARENLPNLSKPLEGRISQVFEEQFTAGSIGRSDGTSKITLHILAGTLIARMNNELLFGADMASDPAFEKDTIKYGWDSAIAMEILRQVPSFIIPAVAKAFMAWSGSMHRVTRRVQVLVNNRLHCAKYATLEKQAVERHRDGTDWVISSSHTMEQSQPLRLTQQMMALLFASTHQMQLAVLLAIVDLCLYPQYVQLLRTEIEAAFALPGGDPYMRLRLLDCFLRESSRLNPLDSLNMQRKVMVPFTFSNGTKVPAGNLVAIPQREMMRDPARYDHPENFNPYRFMTMSESTDAVTKHTDVNWNYTFWGSPHMSCPGRWYASYAMKHVFVHLLNNFDLELMHPERKRNFSWTTATVPRRDMEILMRRRTTESEARAL